MIIWALSATAYGGNRGGAQAVLFARWNQTSVNNLVAAVNEAAPPEFELSQCPFFAGDNRWQNTVALLQGVKYPTTGVVASFFLSFHTDQPHDLASRAGAFNAFLTTPRSELKGSSPIMRAKYLVVSPQLEDQWDDAIWKANVKTMLDRLDENAVLRSGKLSLRRSVLNQATALDGATYAYRRGTSNFYFKIRVERHKFAKLSMASAWSNDGDFVYYPNKIAGNSETADSAQDSVISQRKSLSEFIAATRKNQGTSTLWRPAMNLWSKSYRNNVILWTRSGSPAPWQRTDPTNSPAFDQREKAVLKAYLLGIK